MTLDELRASKIKEAIAKDTADRLLAIHRLLWPDAKGGDMKVFVITWKYSDNSAFGLVGVYDPGLGKQILAALEEHSGIKQFTGDEVEVITT